MTKMMLIEDDATMRSLLKTIFELEGFQVHTQEEGCQEDVERAVREHSPALLFLDVNLRDASGIEITRGLREKFGQSVKIILSSGMPLKAESMQAGADDFILKPFMPDELIYKVKSLLIK